MEIRALGRGDDEHVAAASHLFDRPVDEAASRRFLDDERHHLLVAYVDGHPAGFVSGVEMTHPDKGTEMFLYELEVEESLRRRMAEEFGLLREKLFRADLVVMTYEGLVSLVTFFVFSGFLSSDTKSSMVLTGMSVQVPV